MCRACLMSDEKSRNWALWRGSRLWLDGGACLGEGLMIMEDSDAAVLCR